MRRDDALKRLRDRQPQLRDAGVSELFLFGSVARDQAGADSDVDLLMESADPHFSIFDLVQVKALCREILGAPTDLHHHGGLKRAAAFRTQVEPDLIRVF
ncbi:nucleotidyltransferase family protein [Phenylobacterium aquaticum]|uniref:nucleotidyltransferase family protein n=1 Tax=Phenylobacterium aquaticum TaxID=1763816 RepID=UPI001F5CAA57|nr:nucleotidyltransferase domain-containing protein [Phenylobacterium aquaticum]MCI3131041.1 nucleotidyltransferase domain-containing protein [Phenylobacterium aquaticum]